jgi:hypothetical protein
MVTWRCADPWTHDGSPNAVDLGPPLKRRPGTLQDIARCFYALRIVDGATCRDDRTVGVGLQHNDQLRIAKHGDVGVVGDGHDLPPLLCTAKHGHDGGINKLAVEIVFRLIDDEWFVPVRRQQKRQVRGMIFPRHGCSLVESERDVVEFHVGCGGQRDSALACDHAAASEAAARPAS